MSAFCRIGLIALVAVQAACATVPPPVADTATCEMERIAEAPVRFVGGHVLVPAAINQIPVQLVLDTGASTSLLDADVAERLSLPSDPRRHTTLIGIGGQTVSRNTLLRSLEVGGQEWLSDSIPTGHLADKANETSPVAGLLGADRLANFDVELDMPRGRLTLWQVAHCAGDFVPWHVMHFIIPLHRHNPNRMVAQVEIDGHEVTALVDWGARSTMMTESTAAAVGVLPAMLANDRSGLTWGVDQNQRQARLHRFDEVQIGNETLRHVSLLVSDVHFQEAGMVLGADYVHRRRIWLSYATHQMFVVPPNVVKAPMP